MTFLNVILHKKNFIQQPKGYVQQGVENNVGHLLCALYGLKLSVQI